MTATLRFEVERASGVQPSEFEVERMFNLGSATRDPAVAVEHQDEVAAAGVKIAFDIPAPRIYPISTMALTTDESIDVHGDRTSGEVEIVLVVGDELLVGVGSDHTDRDLERLSILYSKQTCANVLAPRLWAFDEIADHWDECILECWRDGEIYQRTSVASFLSPPDVVRVVRDRTQNAGHGTVIFSGTIVSLTGDLAFGERWEFKLIDPVLDRELVHEYTLNHLMRGVREQYRVPVSVTS